jgi:hypothetical protein
MSLSRYEVGAAVAVSDTERAREFYEGRVGLTAARGEEPRRGCTGIGGRALGPGAADRRAGRGARDDADSGAG